MTLVGVLFFPQRESLKLEGRQYDSQLLELIVTAGASCKSYKIAAKLVNKFLSVGISPKQVSELTTLIGDELTVIRDERTAAWQNRDLSKPKTVADPPPQLACVQLDGGRIQTRGVGLGHGVFQPHWRENKNAGFHRMASESFITDPHPDLPGCFSSRKNMGKLLSGLTEPTETPNRETQDQTWRPDVSWRPKPLFRSCLSSLCGSDEFGPMMAAEADRRGFFTATRRAFLADGLNYNWTVQREHFPSFVPILDFIHPIERLHHTSQAIVPNRDAAWKQTVEWIEECWKGHVEDVIGILKTKQVVIGPPVPESDENDPRRILEETIGYLTNNVERMKYPVYRQQGLPITSCLIESQVKEMNQRIKGSEKFWNDGAEAEAILQVTAALLGDEDQLHCHFQARSGSPYTRNRSPKR